MDKMIVDHGFVVNCEVTISLRRSHNSSCQVLYVQLGACAHAVMVFTVQWAEASLIPRLSSLTPSLAGRAWERG